jgi:RNA polymerase sigma-70 factor (ECF subfamily)
LVEFARARQSQKRGGAAQKVSSDEALVVSPDRRPDLVALDVDLVEASAASYARQSRVVELRFFGGLSVEKTERALQVSSVTAMRDWQLEKSWLVN